MSIELIFEKVGMIAAIVLPLFNIPLIRRVIKRKSSQDLSLVWVIGVWTCFVLMAPSGFASDDVVFKTFNIANLTLFSIVVFVAIKYHKGPSS